MNGKAQPANFFAGFSQGESTYDPGADIGRISELTDGWAPAVSQRYSEHLMDPDFFHESPSGGSLKAWQTFPAPEEVSRGIGDTSFLKWRQTQGGGWQQEYRATNRVNAPAAVFGPSSMTQSVVEVRVSHNAGKMSAGFFDSAVEQYDGYGRHGLPYLASPQRFIDWQERSMNTTLRCDKPGCLAHTSMNVFDERVERARNCRLDVLVHATDFDDEYSGEQVDWISVNRVNMSVACKPRANGCSELNKRLEYPCVRSVSLDEVIPIDGQLEIWAKIPYTVDECHIDGSLLYAIPTVTCQIAPRIPAPILEESRNITTVPDYVYGSYGVPGCPNGYDDIINETECVTAAQYLGIGYNGRRYADSEPRLPYCWSGNENKGNFNLRGDKGTQHPYSRSICKASVLMKANPAGQFNLTVPLHCQAAGCVASSYITGFLPELVKMHTDYNTLNCSMDVLLNATDFDNSAWDQEEEHIDYFRIDDNFIAYNITANVNPCRSRKLPANQTKNLKVLSGYNVTKQIRSGAFRVEARLSPFVDECASQGYLLDAEVHIHCTSGHKVVDNFNSNICNVCGATNCRCRPHKYHAGLCGNGTFAGCYNASSQALCEGDLSVWCR